MMASRRVVSRAFQLASRIQLQQSTSIVSQVSFIRQQSPFPLIGRPSRLPSSNRTYSQASQESKIWNFEDIQKLTQTPKRDVIIVDVREPSELQQTGQIPGAINIPVTTAPDSFHITSEEFEDRFGFPRPEKDAEVLFYCKAGVRSRAAAGLARDAGWKKVGEYPGSWLDWFEKGGKAER